MNCWGSYDLASDDPLANPINPIFKTANLGGELVQSFVRSASGTPGGVMMVVEETHTDLENGWVARSAQNVHTSRQDQSHQDMITIPADQISLDQ